MSAAKQNGKITKDQILTRYMEMSLEDNHYPNNVYQFCKAVSIQEVDFYQHFGSLEAVKSEIWKSFYDNVESLLAKDKEYEQYSNKDKMLAFFYSMFEVLKLNRSYILFALQEGNTKMEQLTQLKDLRSRIKDFAADLIEEANAEKKLKFTKRNVTLFSEGAWVQFAFLLRFWVNDNSANFEKTDLAIEKSVRTIFDLFETTPLESVLDLGKFLFKERFA